MKYILFCYCLSQDTECSSVCCTVGPCSSFSGMLFPTENLPLVLRPITYIVPARWYIDAMRKLMIEGLAFRDVLLELGILAAMTIGIIRVALMKFNDRLE